MTNPQPTPEMIARRIVADTVGAKGAIRALYTSGELDQMDSVRAALAAIIETQELCAKREDRLAEDADAEWQKRQRHDPEDDGSNYLWLRNAHRTGATAIRAGEFLK